MSFRFAKLIQRLYLGELSLCVILGRTKMISTPFFHQKCAKWNTDHGAHGATETTPWAAPRSFGSSAGGSGTRAGSSASCPRARVGPQRLIQKPYLGELSLWVILGRTKMISIPFFHQKCAKWNTDHGAGGAHGATETTPWAAPRSFGSSAGVSGTRAGSSASCPRAIV